jgi:hypothetical protein
LFLSADDVAWWSKKKTTLVFQQLQTQNSDAALVSRLSEQGDAKLAVHGNWCLILARHEIKPPSLPQWLEAVIGIATRPLL